MNEILMYIAIGLAVVIVILELVALRKNATVDLPRLWQTLDTLEKSAQSAERSIREEIGRYGEAVRAEIAKLREEAATAANQSRTDLSGALTGLQGALTQNLTQLNTTLDQKLQRLQEDNAGKLAEVQAAALASAKAQRDEIAKTLTGFQDAVAKNIAEAGKLQQTQLETFAARLDKAAGATEQKLDGVKAAVETKLSGVQADNAKQLAQLRASVDEKLSGTEMRLGESFKAAGERVEQAVARLAPPK